MRKFIVCLILLFATSASAFTLVLPEPLTPPTATQISIDRISILENQKTLRVEYRFLTDTGQEIYVPSGRGASRAWVCQDTTEEPISTCFTEVFGFIIRSQDVGKKFGTGLWQIIWNKMKPDVLKVVGNDINP